MMWTKEKCQEETNKYLTRYEFSKKCSSAHSTAVRNNFLDELFENHINNGYATKKHENWTIEKLQEKANTCLTRSEFWKKESSAATSALNRNIMNELFKNHINSGYTNKQVIEGYWTKEQLQIEANTYNTRGEFRMNNFKAYHSASSKNLIDELFENHINKGYKNNDEYAENNFCIYVYEFKKLNRAYVGLTNDIKRRDKQHLFSKNEKLIQFCKDKNIALPKPKILEKELKSSEAQMQEHYWVNFYKYKGYELFNSAKPGSLGGTKIKWTKNKLQKIADKYENRRDFQINDNLAYSASNRLKLLNEIFKNHKNNGYSEKQVKNGYWTKETIKEEAKKYKFRVDLYKYCGSAYGTALKLNILDEIFEDLPNRGYKKKKSE